MGLVGKIFLLLFCLFNLVHLIEKRNLSPKIKLDLEGSKEETFLIHLTEDKNSYDDFFNIVLKTSNTKDAINYNPIMYIARDANCETDRLFVGTQLIEPIYTFIRKDIIDKQFYICIKKGQNGDIEHYDIDILNNGTAILYNNYQASFYASSESMSGVDIFFYAEEQKIEDNTEITFWVKGKNLTDVSMDENYNSYKYDHGYVFSGKIKGTLNKLSILCEIGDYITVGSTTTHNGETKKRNENSNEIMVASNNEVCIPVIYDRDYSFITGKIYTDNVKTRFTDGKKQTLKVDNNTVEDVITNGILSVMNIFGHPTTEGKPVASGDGFYCLKDSNNGLIIFSIQMTNNNVTTSILNPPMVPGEINRHYLGLHQMAIFYGMKLSNNADEMNFNLKSLKGFPDMYYTECGTFPNCQYTEESIQKLTHPYPSNMVTVHSTYMSEMENKNFTPVTTSQPLMIVYCGAKKGSSFLEDSFCEFETSYFTDKDAIYLPQDNTFSQYLSQDEMDKYQINLLNKKVDKIYLDMMIFSGDSDLVLPHFTGQASKYYLSNKIFYSIHFNNNKPNILEFDVKSSDKTFYMIQYKLLKSDANDDMNTIESGVNYITSKRYDSTDASTNTPKHIQFLNFKAEFDAPYLVTFYSPNCLFDVEWVSSEKGGKEKLATDSYILQKIINKDSDIYGEKFDFYYTIKKDDDSQYPKKFCMVYAAGLELSDPSEGWNKRSISLSEGVPHRYTYNNTYPLIFYSYQISDIKNTFVLNFNLIDNYYFDIYIYINNNNIQNTTIYRNSQIIFKEKDLEAKCNIGGNEFEVCTVDVKIQMRNITKDITMEFMIYQVDNNPFYLEKNVVTDDVVNGNNLKHYYFDISDQEYGDITLDFKRGSGFIYVSVEPQNLKPPMKNPDWRGIYHFPANIEESLKYVTYGKKIIISKVNTTKCSNGCYVLITIESNVRYYGTMVDPDTLFRISLNPRIMKIGENIPIPKVRINLNDFIIGDISKDDKKREYDYYSIILPYNSEIVFFDWQADGPSLLINVGKEKDLPTKGKADIEYNYLGSDSVYQISREEINKIQKISANESIEGLELTIGIYSDIIDSIYYSPYAFKVFMPLLMAEGTKDIMQMIHIRTDQKVQCLPFNYENTKICLFAAIVDDTDAKRNIVIYPKSQDGSPIKIYGKLIKSEAVELNNEQEIAKALKEVYNNGDCLQHDNYIYIQNAKKNESFFFVTTNAEGAIIEVLSSSYTFFDNMTFYPNPSSAQIFAIGDKYINLKFSTTKDLLLNIVCVNGRGRFYWEEGKYNKEYYLSGYNDRLSLTTHTNQKTYVLAPLIAKSDILSQEEIDKGGFIFYITYYPRGYADQIQSNRNTEFHYRTIEMPLSYYIPITPSPWTVNLNFYDINIKDKIELEYELNQTSNLFDIWATIITRDTALKIRTDNNIIINYNNDSCVKGLFDSTFGFIYINSDFLEKRIKELNNTENATIFLKIEKPNYISEDFATLGYEINVFSEKGDGINQVTEGIFISGKLSDSKSNKLVYLLKCDKNRLYMSVQYEANSDLVQFALSKNPKSNKNDKFKNLKIQKIGGTKILTMLLDENSFPEDESIYFIVFTNENKLNPQLGNFLFKYKSSSEPQTFTPMLTKEQSIISFKQTNEEKLRISFYSMPQRYTSYYIKAYYEDGYIEGEKKHTIAITESPGEFKIINDPDGDGIISYEISPKKNISFIKVMARSNVDTDMRFYLYTPVSANNTAIPDPDPEEYEEGGQTDTDGNGGNNNGNGNGGGNDDDKNKKIILFVSIGVGSLFVIIIVILIVFVSIYKRKNNDLAKQVNKISFVQSGAQERESGDDLLLGKDD